MTEKVPLPNHANGSDDEISVARRKRKVVVPDSGSPTPVEQPEGNLKAFNSPDTMVQLLDDPEDDLLRTLQANEFTDPRYGNTLFSKNDQGEWFIAQPQATEDEQKRVRFVRVVAGQPYELKKVVGAHTYTATAFFEKSNEEPNISDWTRRIARPVKKLDAIPTQESSSKDAIVADDEERLITEEEKELLYKNIQKDPSKKTEKKIPPPPPVRRERLAEKAKRLRKKHIEERAYPDRTEKIERDLPAPTLPKQIERGLEETPPESWESYGRQHRESIEQQRQERVIEHENEGHESGAEVRDELPRFIRNEIERRAPERDLQEFYAQKPRKSWFGRMWDRIIGRDDTTDVPDSLKHWASGEPHTGVERLDSQRARAARQAILNARNFSIEESASYLDGKTREHLMNGRWWAGWPNYARIALSAALVAGVKSSLVVGAAAAVSLPAPLAIGILVGGMRAYTSYKQNHSLQEAARRGLQAGIFAGAASLVASNLISHFVTQYGSAVGTQKIAALTDTGSDWARYNNAINAVDASMKSPVDAVVREPLPDISAPTPEAVIDPTIRSFTVESGSLAANSGLDGFVASSQEMQQVVQNLSERSQLQFTDALRRALTSAPNIAEQFMGAPDRIIENASGKDLIFKAGDVLDVDMLEDNDFRKMLADTITKHERILTRELGGADAVRKLLRII